MLYSLVLSETEKFNNTFTVNKSDKGQFIDSGFGQKIRFGKNVKLPDEITNIEATELPIVTYELPNALYVSNNYKNMSLSSFEFKPENEDELINFFDDSILYVTIDPFKYNILGVFPKEDIIQTYKLKNKFVGCIIRFKNDGPKDLLGLKVYDTESKQYNNLNIVLGEDTDDTGNNMVEWGIYPIKNKESLKKLSSALKDKKFKQIKLFYKNSTIPVTNTFITTPDNKEALVEAISKADSFTIENCNIIEVNDESSINEKKSEFDKIFTEDRVCAVTCAGIKLPYDFIKKYKIKYVFNFIDGKFINVKSR